MITKVLNSGLTRFWLALSVTAFVSLQLTSNSLVGAALNMALAFILSLWLEYQYSLLTRLMVTRSRRYLFISLAFAVCATVEMGLVFQKERIDRILSTDNERALTTNNQLVASMLSKTPDAVKFAIQYLSAPLVAIIACFSVFVVTYAIVSRTGGFLVRVWRSLDLIEHHFIIIALSIFSLCIVVVYSLTQVSYNPQGQNDVIFTADSSYIVSYDSYFLFYSPANDIRQPLFSLVTFPFAVVSKIVAIPLFFFPNAYILVMQIVLVAMLMAVVILLGRMMELKNSVARILFYVTYVVTYPFLLFMIVVEQYIPTLFVTVLAIYWCIYLKRQGITLLALATGMLLVNSVIALFSTHAQSFVKWVQFVVKTLLVFVALCVFAGKVPVLLDAVAELKGLLRFADMGGGGGAKYDKFQQFTNFVANCFVAPDVELSSNINGFATYQLATPTSVNVLPGFRRIRGF